MPPKKMDLKKLAKKANNAEVDSQITDELLREYCPKEVLTRFKAAKTPAARADFLYLLEKNELKALRDAHNKMDKFVSKLEAWFIQEFESDQKGVTGKVGRVEVKNKEIGTVENWDAFYTHIKKKGEFDLLNKAVNQKAVQERWEQKKQIPGVGKFIKKVISLTGVKK